MSDEPTSMGDVLRERARHVLPEPPKLPTSPVSAAAQVQRSVEQVRRGQEEAKERSQLGLWARLVPAKYQHASPDDFPPEVAQELHAWSAPAMAHGRSLLITGPTGTGKTHAAFAAAFGPFRRGMTVAFWPVEELRLALDWRSEGHLEVQREAASVGLLILDDLGVSDGNDWWLGKLYAIVNRRWLDDLPTIATTNLDPQNLEVAIGERIYSRLAQGTMAVRLSGDDRRRQRAR